MIVDRDWTFSYVNRLAIETLNIPILGQKFFELASSISHKINNPLEAITNLLYLIALSEGLPPELKGYVQSAQAKLSRVSQIATQTLRFHRQAVAPRW